MGKARHQNDEEREREKRSAKIIGIICIENIASKTARNAADQFFPVFYSFYPVDKQGSRRRPALA